MKRELKLFDELDRFAFGAEITHALGLSYGYDGDLANERLWKPLVEKYGLRHPIVITDGAVAEGTSLGIHVLRARRKGGVFHPKLFLAVREDAVFVAIGSANLTKGGLGGNLELLTPLLFSRDAERPPPRGVLEGILDFVSRVAKNLRVADDSAGRVLDIVEQAKLVLDDLPEPRRGPDLRFAHSFDAPIWDQLRSAHGDDAVQHVLVVSPFLEADTQSTDPADSLLRHVLDDGLPWGARAKLPRLTLCTDAIDPSKPMPLPRLALEELGAKVELRAQALSVEPRRLHGKLVAVFGKKRTTMLWGSPNFTPSALQRTPAEHGNVECALVLSTAAGSADIDGLLEELDLGNLFLAHRGALPPAYVPLPQTAPVFEVGESIYDTTTRVLSVHGEVWSKEVDRIRVSLVEDSGVVVLHESATLRPGSYALEIASPPLEEEDAETGKRRLRVVSLLVEALDASGRVLEQQAVRYNVRFEDALGLRDNLIIETEALTADAMLMPTATPEQRVAVVDGKIAAWKAIRRGDQNTPTRHQASLDTFFLNVRLGLDKQWSGLQARRMSRFALRRWSADLRRSLGAAVPSSLDGIRRAFLVTRIAEHVESVLGAIPEYHEDLAPAFAALEADKLAAAFIGVTLEDDTRPEVLEEVRDTRARVIASLQTIAAGEVEIEKPKHRARRGA